MPSPLRPLAAGLVLGALLCRFGAPEAAAQEASVRQEGTLIVVEARDATRAALLRALADETGLVVEGVEEADLEGRLSGSRRGSLEQLLAWLLQGHGYALVYSPATARAERLLVGTAPATGGGGSAPAARERPLDEKDDWGEEDWGEEDWEDDEGEEWWRSSLLPPLGAAGERAPPWTA